MYSDLYTSLRLLYSQSAIVPVRSNLCKVLKELYSSPRSLMQQSRVTIYKQFRIANCSLVKGVNKLNVPNGIVRYLLYLT